MTIFYANVSWQLDQLDNDFFAKNLWTVDTIQIYLRRRRQDF